jgi:hypothetical protein
MTGHVKLGIWAAVLGPPPFPVCVVLIVLGAAQIVRGAGFFPMILGCETESGTMGFCRPTVIVG